MRNLPGNEIRSRFLEYFRSKGHEVVPSSSVVPAGDPTLLFANAGMNQFKDTFLGREARPYRRAATAQKCIRAGGKHNDLDQVGRTARHHTFFEMLGNFSFGDYFKAEAVSFAWDLLTGALGIDPDRLTATIYTDDDEAFAIWSGQIGLPPERIVRLGEKDNFWSMGDTGPCGPCSEIIYDRGSELACGPAEACGVGRCECDRWLEVWNLVFMQFDRDGEGRLTPLPRPCVDTGMGLERVASVLQGVSSNYETDLFRPFIDWLTVRTGRPYDRGGDGFPFRVVADHVRCCAIIIADGVQPSNEGRGYVLRRILRRAARFGRVLGFARPFLHEMVPLVVSIMGAAYPEVADKASFIESVIEGEETRFLERLSEGTRRAEEMLEAVTGRAGSGGGRLSGPEAFLLYDTFGFPIDLTEDMAAERGVAVDRAGFEAAMEEQRRRAREAREAAGPGDETAVLSDLLAATPGNSFCGYDRLGAETTVLALAAHGESLTGGAAPRLLSEASAVDGEVYVLLAETPFYAEGGGQVADQGWLTTEAEVSGASAAGPVGTAGAADLTGGPVRAVVQRAFRLPDSKILIAATVTQGRLVLGAGLLARVDARLRQATARSHTATHLLHRALRDLLGEQAAQAGSLVASDRLRFDFSNLGPLTSSEVIEVENRVNQAILADYPLGATVMPYREAVASGAVALFGEKYGDQVRVVAIEGVSRELCGGTHVHRTGEIGLFKITAESGIGSGLRRIEAVTGLGFLERFREIETTLAETAAALKCEPGEAAERAARLQSEIRSQERERERLASRAAQSSAATIATEAESIGPFRLAVGLLPAMSMDNLRQACDHIRDSLRGGPQGRGDTGDRGGAVVLLGAPTEDGERVSFVAMVSRLLVDKGVHAGKLIGEVARAAGGGGGGRPDMAQAGGRQPSQAREALERGRVLLRGLLEEMTREGKNTPD
jgi:alanyl-tRNA synthetase